MPTNEFTILPNPSPVRISASSYHALEQVYVIGAVMKNEPAVKVDN